MRLQRILNLTAIAIFVLLSNNFRSPALAAELEKIQQRGKLIVAVKDNLPPLGFADTSGKLQGLEIDLARHLAEELLGDPDAVVFVPVTNQERLDVVLEGKVDLTIARVTATTSRSRIVDLSRYYYLDGTGLISKSSLIEKLEDLAYRKVAVLNNSTTIATIRNDLPAAELIGVNSYQEALSLLEKGEVDAFAADRSLLAGWVREYPQYHLLPERLSVEPLCVVMPKGLQYGQLHRRVNEAISLWQSDGLPERITYWGLP
jgi:polar amino acid transport system substrate-binding protein